MKCLILFLVNNRNIFNRALKISKPDPTAYNKAPMTRVDTNASTLPMFPNVRIQFVFISNRLFSCQVFIRRCFLAFANNDGQLI